MLKESQRRHSDGLMVGKKRVAFLLPTQQQACHLVSSRATHVLPAGLDIITGHLTLHFDVCAHAWMRVCVYGDACVCVRARVDACVCGCMLLIVSMCI